jgi:hypothetical protein
VAWVNRDKKKDGWVRREERGPSAGRKDETALRIEFNAGEKDETLGGIPLKKHTISSLL